MDLLLDTHIWIWMTLEPARLSNRVARALQDLENPPISVWELLMLTRRQRVRLNEDAVTWARRTIGTLGLSEATLTSDVALEVSSLRLFQGDSADRLLAATAKVFDLTLVTADNKLIGAPGLKVLANR